MYRPFEADTGQVLGTGGKLKISVRLFNNEAGDCLSLTREEAIELASQLLISTLEVKEVEERTIKISGHQMVGVRIKELLKRLDGFTQMYVYPLNEEVITNLRKELEAPDVTVARVTEIEQLFNNLR